MRKVIYLVHVSLDGYVAGPNGEMNWISFDDELEKYVHELHNTSDAAIYGRVTYQMMESYWPTVLTNPDSAASALDHARWLDDATKIVFSRTLDKVTWKNSILLRGNIAEEMTQIKQQPGRNFFMVGSISVAQELMRHNLIDEYRINVNPVILGSGKPLFVNLNGALKLNLLEAKTFKGGVVALRYEPARM